MASRVEQMFAAYDGVHASRGNIACHVLGVPMIYGSAAGLLRLLAIDAGPARLDLGMLFLIALVYLWARLDLRLGILAAIAAPAVWVAGSMLTPVVLLIVFFVGNAVPLAGHVFFEKGGPKSLDEGLSGTLIAPIWVINLAVRLIPRAPGSR